MAFNPPRNPLSTFRRSASGVIKRGERIVARRNPYRDRTPIEAITDRGMGGEVDRKVQLRDRRAILKGMPLRQQQRWLAEQGYDVMVDGKKGPNTITALDAFMRGKAPKQYNRWWRGKIQVRDDHHDDTPVTPTGQRDVPTRPTPKGTKPRAAQLPPVRSGKGKGKGRITIPAGRASNNPFLRDDTIDPEFYANAVADAEYGPILAELLRQEQRATTVGTNRVAEIRDMYGEYARNTGEQYAQANRERERLAAATGGLTQAIQGAVPLGEAGAAELAARGNINTEFARAMDLVGDEEARRAVLAAESGGIFAAGQAQRGMDEQVQDIAAKRVEAVAAKGATKSKAKQELIRWNAEQALNRAQLSAQIQSDRMKNQLAALQSMAAMQMLPLESEAKRAQIEAMYADMQRQNALLPLQIAQGKANIGATAALAKQRLTPRPKARGAGDQRMPRNFTALRPNDLAELEGQITERLGNAKSYTQAVPIINNYLRSIGYKPKGNKKVGNFARSIAASWGASMGMGPPLANWWR